MLNFLKKKIRIEDLEKGLWFFFFFLYSYLIFKKNSYLVDPASSHMLVLKIKPCTSKDKYFLTVNLRMAH